MSRRSTSSEDGAAAADSASAASTAADLNAACAQVDALLSEDADFERAIDGSTIEYVLVDDYDVGSVAVCRLQDGVLVWPGTRPA